MTETRIAEDQAYLRHEYRTPVNHIIGYSELLIEDAEARHLNEYVPVFERIREGGRELLEAIQLAFSEQNRLIDDSQRRNFKTNLHLAALGISATLTSLLEEFNRNHRQTIADLDAISWAIRRLLDLAGADGVAEPKPPVTTHRAPSQSNEAPVRVKRGAGKILIADDDAANRNILRRRLECDGHVVVEAENGLNVLALLRESPCDLVLLDIMMPAMDGFQTLARMKLDASLRDLPVIMISALDELESVVRCIEMGADDYLPKPFNRVLLRARIGASLEKKWLRDRERRKTEELEQTLRLLESAQEQLALIASRDALTGLANRRCVETHIDSLVKSGTSFSVIFIDLNGFKNINDTYGHSAGDDLLKQVSEKLRTVFRSTDLIGRWGGDEFVALAELTAVEVQKRRDVIAKCFDADFFVRNGGDEQRIQIGASVGFATWKPGDSVTEVFQHADFAMYAEKLRRAG